MRKSARPADWVVRCDGSRTIGMGHVMRCLALASALRQRGGSVHFAMRDLPGEGPHAVIGGGFPVRWVPESSGDTAEDPESTGALVRGTQSAGVVIDHYCLDARYFQLLASSGIRVAVIDDLADRDLSAAVWLLNQSPEAGLLPYRLREDCIRLWGPAYALVRPFFLEVRERSARPFAPGDRRVLIVLGGGDTAVWTAAVLRELDGVAPRVQIRCVLGGEQPIPHLLAEVIGRSPHEVQVVRPGFDLSEHMQWADLSINAGGGTCWELCCVGVPMLVVAGTADQVQLASALHRAGCAEYVGGPGDGALARRAVTLLADPGHRQRLSARARALVDGRGAGRAAESLISLVSE